MARTTWWSAIAADPAFMVTREEIEAILQPEKFIGRSKEQVEEYLAGIITPLLQKTRNCWEKSRS